MHPAWAILWIQLNGFDGFKQCQWWQGVLASMAGRGRWQLKTSITDLIYRKEMDWGHRIALPYEFLLPSPEFRR